MNLSHFKESMQVFILKKVKRTPLSGYDYFVDAKKRHFSSRNRWVAFPPVVENQTVGLFETIRALELQIAILKYFCWFSLGFQIFLSSIIIYCYTSFEGEINSINDALASTKNSLDKLERDFFYENLFKIANSGNSYSNFPLVDFDIYDSNTINLNKTDAVATTVDQHIVHPNQYNASETTTPNLGKDYDETWKNHISVQDRRELKNEAPEVIEQRKVEKILGHKLPPKD